MKYLANEKRYEDAQYRKCGESGLKLPAVSLGLWHNFGDTADFDNMCKMCFFGIRLDIESSFIIFAVLFFDIF